MQGTQLKQKLACHLKGAGTAGTVHARSRPRLRLLFVLGELLLRVVQALLHLFLRLHLVTDLLGKLLLLVALRSVRSDTGAR